jgi:hypothetical protein
VVYGRVDTIMWNGEPVSAANANTGSGMGSLLGKCTFPNGGWVGEVEKAPNESQTSSRDTLYVPIP